MTIKKNAKVEGTCPAQALLKQLSGKWKPEIFKLAVNGPIRFSNLLRQLEGANKQAITVALRDLEEAGLLLRVVIQQKPLHIEYILTDQGRSMIPVFIQLEGLA